MPESHERDSWNREWGRRDPVGPRGLQGRGQERSAHCAPLRFRADGPVIAAMQGGLHDSPRHGFDEPYPEVRRLRTINVIDDFNCQMLRFEIDTSMLARRIVRTLLAARWCSTATTS